MLLSRKFKARLTALPKIRKKEGAELENLGSFTVGKKYLVLSVFSTLEFSDFLVADDKGVFHWINMSFFRN